MEKETFGEETLATLMQLSHIRCSEQEKTTLAKNIRAILEHIDRLKEVETKGIPPCSHVLEELVSGMREDVCEENSLDLHAFLQNAPSHMGRMIRVPPIITPP